MSIKSEILDAIYDSISVTLDNLDSIDGAHRAQVTGAHGNSVTQALTVIAKDGNRYAIKVEKITW